MTEPSFSDARHALSMSQKSGEDILDLVVIPYSMEVSPDTPDIMYLEFQDKFEHIFRFASRYELVAYNGYMQETECVKSLVFNFINMYPYGFIIKDGNDYFLYQNQVMSVPADQEDQ